MMRRFTFRSRSTRAFLAVAISVVVAAGVAGLPREEPVPSTPRSVLEDDPVPADPADTSTTVVEPTSATIGGEAP